MSKIDSNEFQVNFEDQLKVAQQLMEAPGVKIHVLGIAVKGDNVMMARSVSAGTTRLEAQGIIEALQHEIVRIKNLLA